MIEVWKKINRGQKREMNKGFYDVLINSYRGFFCFSLSKSPIAKQHRRDIWLDVRQFEGEINWI